MVVSPTKSNHSGDTTILPATYICLRFYHLLYNLLQRKMLYKFILNKIAIYLEFIDKIFKYIVSKKGFKCGLYNLYIYITYWKIPPSP